MAEQPAMTSDFGVILSLGIQMPRERTAIVIPLATDDTTRTPFTICNDIGNAFTQNALPTLLACISSVCFVNYVQAEGMVDGCIPSRNDFLPSAAPGTFPGGPDCVQEQVSAMIAFYANPDDITGGARIRVGKTFLPGTDEGGWDNGYVNDDLHTAMVAWGDLMRDGFDFDPSGSKKVYRVVSAPRPRVTGINLVRVSQIATRRYSGTQKRRLLPRG